jgi:hypothetical protein
VLHRSWKKREREWEEKKTLSGTGGAGGAGGMGGVGGAGVEGWWSNRVISDENRGGEGGERGERGDGRGDGGDEAWLANAESLVTAYAAFEAQIGAWGLEAASKAKPILGGKLLVDDCGVPKGKVRRHGGTWDTGVLAHGLVCIMCVCVCVCVGCGVVFMVLMCASTLFYDGFTSTHTHTHTYARSNPHNPPSPPPPTLLHPYSTHPPTHLHTSETYC